MKEPFHTLIHSIQSAFELIICRAPFCTERYCWKKALGAKQEHKPHADQSSLLLKIIVMIIEEKTLPRKIVFPTAVHWRGLVGEVARFCSWRLGDQHVENNHLHCCIAQWLKKPPSSWWVIISMTVMYSYLRPGDLENAFFTVSLILFSISLNCYPSKGWKLFIWWAQLNTNGHNQTMAATVKQAAWSN